MEKVKNKTAVAVSRSPHGERGLKFCCIVFELAVLSRSPHGERGLKFHILE